MCLSSELLLENAFPHISQSILLGSIPRRGSSCNGAVLGMVERVLVCLAIDGFFSIKSTSGIERVAYLLNVCGYILAITNLTKKK